MQFDLNNRFLVGYGGREFFMLDLRHEVEEPDPHDMYFGRLKFFTLNEFLYDKIVSMTICTNAMLDAGIYENHLTKGTSKNLT